MRNSNHRSGGAAMMNGSSFISTVAVLLAGIVLVGGCDALSAVRERGILPADDLIISFLTSEDGPLSAHEFTLTVEVEGGGSVDPGSGTFESDEEVRLTATPDEGWRFDHWEGDLTGGPFDHWQDPSLEPANLATLVMDTDKVVTAVYVSKQTSTETFDLGGSVMLTVISIPGGTFTMGSSDVEQARFLLGGLDFSDESPQHTVAVSNFAMGETEITQAQFEALMGYVPNIPESCRSDCFEIALGDSLPAAWVTWAEAVVFCEALSAVAGRRCRLPTEAEWEYACRAGSTTAFNFGDSEEDVNDHAWWSGNSGWPRRDVNPHEVASKLPNAWGLYDTHGNVWEWVGDWWDAYPSEAVVDPVGPRAPVGEHSHKVLRGAAYNRDPWALRSAYRFNTGPGAQFNFGFRIVCE